VIGTRRRQPIDLLGQGLAGAGDGVALEVTGGEQLPDHGGEATVGLDVDHRIGTERAHVDDHR